MPFLQKSDLLFAIKSSLLTTITGGDDNIIGEICSGVTQEMKSYIATRYSADTLFAATGENRHKALVQYGRDMAIYRIYALTTTIPQQRVDRFKAAIDFLKDVSGEKINLYGANVGAITASTIYVRSGGNDKRENYQT